MRRLDLAAAMTEAEKVRELLGGIKTADGVFCVDADQRIVHWSERAEEMLGHAASDVLGRQCYDVLGGLDSQNNRFCRPDCPVVANARRGRATGDYDVLSRTTGGVDTWINVSVLVLKGKKQRRPYLMHLLRDVTERRRVEGLARRAMEALREIEEGAGDAAETLADSRPTPLPPLSQREMEVLRLLAVGMTTPQVAEHLGISPITARNHITHVVSKLGAKSRLQAVLYASKRRLI